MTAESVPVSNLKVPDTVKTWPLRRACRVRSLCWYVTGFITNTLQAESSTEVMCTGNSIGRHRWTPRTLESFQRLPSTSANWEHFLDCSLWACDDCHALVTFDLKLEQLMDFQRRVESERDGEWRKRLRGEWREFMEGYNATPHKPFYFFPNALPVSNDHSISNGDTVRDGGNTV